MINITEKLIRKKSIGVDGEGESFEDGLWCIRQK